MCDLMKIENVDIIYLKKKTHTNQPFPFFSRTHPINIQPFLVDRCTVKLDGCREILGE